MRHFRRDTTLGPLDRALHKRFEAQIKLDAIFKLGETVAFFGLDHPLHGLAQPLQRVLHAFAMDNRGGTNTFTAFGNT